MKSRYFFFILVAAALAYLLLSNASLRASLDAAIVALIKPVLILIVGIIVEPSFVYSASALMFVVAIGLCLYYQFAVVGPRLLMFRKLQAAVRSLRLPERAAPDQRFEALRSLGDALRSAQMFLSAWALFQSDFAASARIPNHPFRYFAASDPDAEATDNRGFMSALPGYFTSVGLILTFLGLVIALYFAAKGFRSGNMDEARQSILQLLNASAFKFITSVAALGCSLFISVFHRFVQSRIRYESVRTIATIDAYIAAWRDVEMLTLGPIKIAAAQDMSVNMQAMLDALAKLTAEMQHLAARIPAATAAPSHVEH